MSENILILFVIALSVQSLLEIFLVLLNLKHAKKSENLLNPILANLYDQETKEKSLKYTETKSKFSIFSNLYNLIILFILLWIQFFPKIDLWLAQFALSPRWHGVFYLLLISLILSAFNLPLSFYSTFVIEEKFGFNKSTKALWLKDLIIGQTISAAIMIPLIYLILLFMDTAGANWWLYAGLAVAAIQIFLVFVYPIWIAPLFNKFSPLEEGELKTSIVKVVDEVGYKTTGVFVVDGSKRSSHANAYFTGLGKSKRIVLFDTLISILNTPQVLSVLAHEIGHERYGHIKKSLGFSVLMLLFGFFCVGKLAMFPELFQAFGFSTVSNHAALLIFSLISGPVMFLVGPLFHMLSRRYEYQADDFALKVMKSYEPLATALAALSKKSLSNLNPHPLYSFVHYSHPTLNERINAMAGKEVI